MAGNSNLRNANKAKNDEFYTQLADVESELKHYRKHFAGKTIFCNCDDPYESNFFKYFAMNFNYLGLKYKAILIEDKMYAIHWFDYIDDEWSIVWCTEDKFERSLEDVKDAEVEYYIKEYN